MITRLARAFLKFAMNRTGHCISESEKEPKRTGHCY